MPTTLEAILTRTRQSIRALREQRPALERAAADAPVPPPFAVALRGAQVALIAEVKRRSPSAGAIRVDLDAAATATAYAQAGASAVSVLTDEPFFGGSLDDLRDVAAAVTVPVLRKDFILCEEQILEACAAGASAVLLIAHALAPARLRELRGFAESAGLAALVEIHDARELHDALGTGAGIVGVNSRSLDTFAIDTGAAWALLSQVPPHCIAVAESGMATAADVRRAADSGADAVLIGTALSAASSPAREIADIVGVPRVGR